MNKTKALTRIISLVMAILLIASVGIVPTFAAAPAAPSKVVSAQSTSAIKLTWTKVSGATGYRIYYKLPGDITWRTALSSTAKTTHTFTGLPEAQSYLFAVRSYSKSGSKVTWGGYRQIATATQTAAPKKILAEQSVSAIRLTWSEVETATGYRILYKTNSADEWKTAATTKNTTHTFENLPAGKKYSFAVQSYVKSSLGTFYGRYITVETATKPATLDVKATATESAITLSWGKVSADGYRVYYKLPSTNWAVAVNSTTATKVTFKNVDATKGYSFIVRPYVKTASGVIWGGYKEYATGRPVLTMATNAEFPPYEYYENDKITGIDIEIATLIAEKLGMDLKIYDVAFDAIMPGVQSGKYDIGMAGLTVSEERLEIVDFSISYAKNIQSVVVKKGSDIKTLDDISGKRIGVKYQSVGEIYASSEFGEKFVVRYVDVTATVQALSAGKIDCAIIDNELAKSYVAANEGLKILDTHYVAEDYAICFNKDDAELRSKVNMALEELIADGTVQSIINKYTLDI